MSDFEDYYAEFQKLPFERIQEKFRRRRLLHLLKSYNIPEAKRVLEVGPGFRSLFLDSSSQGTVTILEPIKALADEIESAFGSRNVVVLNQTLEKFGESVEDNQFNVIIMSSNLHEVNDDKKALKIAYRILEKDGLIFIVVPNNKSIHRLIGVDMELLMSQESLTKTEIIMQQKRNYSPHSLSQKLVKTGFMIDQVFTSFVKPLTHLQMQTGLENTQITEDMLEQLYNLSEIFNPYASEIFIVGKKI